MWERNRDWEWEWKGWEEGMRERGFWKEETCKCERGMKTKLREALGLFFANNHIHTSIERGRAWEIERERERKRSKNKHVEIQKEHNQKRRDNLKITEQQFPALAAKPSFPMIFFKCCCSHRTRSEEHSIHPQVHEALTANSCNQQITHKSSRGARHAGRWGGLITQLHMQRHAASSTQHCPPTLQQQRTYYICNWNLVTCALTREDMQASALANLLIRKMYENHKNNDRDTAQ